MRSSLWRSADRWIFDPARSHRYLLIDISVAIVSTKIPVLLGHGFWGFSVTKLPRYGFCSMMHEARTDFSMWLGLLFC